MEVGFGPFFLIKSRPFSWDAANGRNKPFVKDAAVCVHGCFLVLHRLSDALGTYLRTQFPVYAYLSVAGMGMYIYSLGTRNILSRLFHA